MGMISDRAEWDSIDAYNAEQARIREMLYELCSLADNDGFIINLPKAQQEWYAREVTLKRFQQSTTVACSPMG